MGKNNLLVAMQAIVRLDVKLYDLPVNPLASVDRFRVPGVLAGGGLEPRPGSTASDTDGRNLTNSCVNRPAPRRAARPALVGRRLPRVDDQGPRELCGQPPDDAEVGEGPRCVDGSGGRERPRAVRWRSARSRLKSRPTIERAWHRRGGPPALANG